MPPAGEVRVSYGHATLPGRDQPAVGGIVKLQDLQRRYPHEPRTFSILYLVTSNLPDDAVSLARAAKDKGARIVVNQNGVAYRGWFGDGWEAINAPMIALLELADHVFYQSEFCRLSADRFLGSRQGPSEILYNAVDTTRFHPATTSGAGGLTLLLGGSQTFYYRVNAALRVLAEVLKTRSDARLLIAGRLRWDGDEGASRRAAEAGARELGVADRVEFIGPYSQDDAPALYRRADMLLHTKYNDPCPSVVIEAMASGLPIVYSATGGVPELVGDNAGIGVGSPLDWERDQPPDPVEMAAAVLRAAEDRARLSAAARRRAVERFDTAAWMNRHQEVFEALVA